MVDKTNAPVNTDPFISKVSLGNFKSVVDQEVDLARLTLLVGENSSGKSSVLQVLRLLQQGLQSESTGDRFPLNGDLIRMGTIDDIRNARKEFAKENVSIGVEVAGFTRSRIHRLPRYIVVPSPSQVSWHIDLSGTAPDEPGSTYIKSLNLVVFDKLRKPLVSLNVSRRGNKSKIFPVFYRKNPGESRWFRRRVLSKEMEITLAFKGMLEDSSSKSTKISGLALMESLPSYLTVKKSARRVYAEEWLRNVMDRNEKLSLIRYGRKREDKHGQGSSAREKGKEIRDKARLIEYAIKHINTVINEFDNNATPDDLFSSDLLLNDDLWSEIRASEGIYEKIVKAISKGLNIRSQIDVLYNDITEEDLGILLIREIIGKIRYLGPLREEPRFVMLTSPTAGMGYLGIKGEFTAAVLYNHLLGGQKREYPLPNTKENIPINLVQAVKAWVLYLGLVEDVVIEDLAALGLTIKVRSQGIESELPLPSVGVGVSQLLPVLVLCLLAEPGSVVLLEQPELHLHPALQQKLADFFIAVARSGRQLIVETHSEYFVSRLRRRVVEDPDDELLKLVKIVSAERDGESGETRYRDLDLTPYGEIEDWPKGFFDQAAEDEREIIRGALKKRRDRRPPD